MPARGSDGAPCRTILEKAPHQAVRAALIRCSFSCWLLPGNGDIAISLIHDAARNPTLSCALKKRREMSVYLIARVKVKYGHANEAAQIIEKFAEVLKPYKWKLLHSFYPLAGDLREITDIWEVPDANAVTDALSDMPNNKEWLSYFEQFKEHAEEETLSIVGQYPFSGVTS
jgi:hypothetical protein